LRQHVAIKLGQRAAFQHQINLFCTPPSCKQATEFELSQCTGRDLKLGIGPIKYIQ